MGYQQNVSPLKNTFLNSIFVNSQKVISNYNFERWYHPKKNQLSILQTIESQEWIFKVHEIDFFFTFSPPSFKKCVFGRNIKLGA